MYGIILRNIVPSQTLCNCSERLKASSSVLRGMKTKTHNAFVISRKFASGKHLEELVHFSLDKVTEVLQKQEDAIDPLDILNLLVYNIIAAMVFGKRLVCHCVKFIVFLALLCATAQQSYCRHAGVRRPSSSVVRPSSVDIVFSETVKRIDTKCY